jgi:hypothetical protein
LIRIIALALLKDNAITVNNIQSSGSIALSLVKITKEAGLPNVLITCSFNLMAPACFSPAAMYPCQQNLEITISISSFGGAIAWSSHRQTCTATYTNETKYIAASDASKKAIWLQQLLIQIDSFSKQP